MKTYLPTLFLLLLFTQVWTQTDPIIGDWKGVITQNAGGFRPQYDFEIFIRLDDAGNYVGQTYVQFENSYAKMKFGGKWLDDKTFLFTESEILDSVELNDMDWCIKMGKLKLERKGTKILLTGAWSGVSSFGNCVPGYIVLKKKEPRA